MTGSLRWQQVRGDISQKIVLNIGNIFGPELAFANLAKTGFTPSISTNAQSVLDGDGYPTGTLAAAIGQSFTLPLDAAADSWTLAWEGTIGDATHGYSFATGITVTDTISGVVNSGGAGTGSTIFRGTDGHFEFTFADMPKGDNALSTSYQNGTAFTNYRNLILCRTADYDDIKNNGRIWHQTFLDAIAELDPGVLRPMGAFLDAGNETTKNPQWQYRAPLTSLSYRANRIYVAGIWAGTITNSGQAYTAPSYTDMPVSYQDGDVFMGDVSATPSTFSVSAVATSSGKVKLTLDSSVVSQLTDGDPVCYSGYTATGGISGYSTGFWAITKLSATEIELTTGWQTGLASSFLTYSSSPGSVSIATVDSGGRGKRPIYKPGIFPNVGSTPGMSTTGNCVFVYSELLRAFSVTSGALNARNPELFIDLCNTLNMHLWANLSWFATNDYAESYVTAIRDDLNSGLSCVFEPFNEPWNFAFNQNVLMNLCGVALNLATSPANYQDTNTHAFQGLRAAMLSDIVRPIWDATRDPSQFKMVVTNWALTARIALFKAQALEGTLLNAATNAVLSAYTGGQSYNVGSPTFSRPVDKLSLISFAPYVYLSPANEDATYAWAEEYATGDPEAALDLYDAAVRTAVDIYQTGGSGNDCFNQYETLCASYDNQRPPGFGPLDMWSYEGFMENDFPTVANYVTEGFSVSSTVTFDIPNLRVVWTGHPLQDGCKVALSVSGGSLPSNLSASTNYYVCNSTIDDFQLSLTTVAPTHPVVVSFGGSSAGSGTFTATAAEYSIDNLIVAYLSDSVRAPAITNYIFRTQTNPRNYPHLKRGAVLALSGFNAWSVYPYLLRSYPPFKTYDGIAAFDAGAV